jgi:ADP-ribose pyrophosphatase
MPYPQSDQTEKTIASEVRYKGHILNLRLDTVCLPNGRTATREIVEHRGAVGIVPLDRQGNVILVRQFRKAIERSILEIPAGTREQGEDIEKCLHRELSEETGYTAGRIERLAGYYSAVGFCNEFIEIYLATDLSSGEADPDEDEFVDIVSIPLIEALRMLESGEIVDAKTFVGLLSLKARGPV